MEYIKHFNAQSDKYLCFRPDYPTLLFDFLTTLVCKDTFVWDCGTGNGQAALTLANKFHYVFATDISWQQLEVASQKENLCYVCCPAEKTPFSDQSIDLITIAQALHWFNFDNFYREVRRIAKPSSLIAAWCYSLGMINPSLDPFIRMLYLDILGDQYWPTERRYIDERYETIPFPFKKMVTPEFLIEKKMDFHSFIGYLNTWSAVKEYQKCLHKNPIELVYEDMLLAWGNLETEHIMRWPVHLLIGRVE